MVNNLGTKLISHASMLALRLVLSPASKDELACSDPPQGPCHWTLQLLADELVVLGLVERVGIETVRKALKKTTSSRGSSRPGASRRTRTPSTSGAWRT
jgi:hypothetical protein